MFGNWAEGSEEQTVANIKFKVADGADLTSAATSIRVKSLETATGYEFYGKDLTLGTEASEPVPTPDPDPTPDPVKITYSDTTPPAEPYQEAYLDTTGISSLTGGEGEEFTLPLKYKASDGASTTGIKLAVFYDSSVITPLEVTDQLAASAVSCLLYTSDAADE